VNGSLQFRHSGRDRLLALAGFLALAAATGGGAWIIFQHDEYYQELRWLLIPLSPALVPAMFVLSRCSLLAFWRRLYRYTVGPDRLVVHRPRDAESLTAGDIVDASILDGGWDRPPRTLRLHLRGGRTLDVPLNLVPAEPLRAALLEFLKPAGVATLDQIRQSTHARTPSIAAIKWKRYGDSAFFGYVALVFFLGAGFMLVVHGRQTLDYHRIRADRVAVEGRVVEFKTGRRHSTATVDYTPADGVQRRIRRDVARSFEQRFSPGHAIVVEHWAAHPDVARLAKEDLDARAWLWMLIEIPVLWILGVVTWHSFKQIVAPLQEELGFAAARGDAASALLVGLDKPTLATVARAFPDRYANAPLLVIDAHRERHTIPASILTGRLKKTGIDADVIVDEFLFLGANATRSLLGRLEPDDELRADHFVLPPEQPAEARLRILEHLRKETRTGAIPSTDASFICVGGAVGPCTHEEAAAAFDRLIKLSLSRLYEQAPPEGLLDLHAPAHFELDSVEGAFAVLVERNGEGAQAWVHKGGETHARAAVFRSGRWTPSGCMKVPRALRDARLPWTQHLFLAPFYVILAVAVLPVLPLYRLSMRMRRRRIERHIARQRADTHEGG
jgi:hypothetical protein